MACLKLLALLAAAFVTAQDDLSDDVVAKRRRVVIKGAVAAAVAGGGLYYYTSATHQHSIEKDERAQLALHDMNRHDLAPDMVIHHVRAFAELDHVQLVLRAFARQEVIVVAGAMLPS